MGDSEGKVHSSASGFVCTLENKMLILFSFAFLVRLVSRVLLRFRSHAVAKQIVLSKR